MPLPLTAVGWIWAPQSALISCDLSAHQLCGKNSWGQCYTGLMTCGSWVNFKVHYVGFNGHLLTKEYKFHNIITEVIGMFILVQNYLELYVMIFSLSPLYLQTELYRAVMVLRVVDQTRKLEKNAFQFVHLSNQQHGLGKQQMKDDKTCKSSWVLHRKRWSAEFWLPLWWTGGKFRTWLKKAWIHGPSLTRVQIGGGIIIVWGMPSWHSLVPSTPNAVPVFLQINAPTVIVFSFYMHHVSSSSASTRMI